MPFSLTPGSCGLLNCSHCLLVVPSPNLTFSTEGVSHAYRIAFRVPQRRHRRVCSRELVALGWNILASGGTARALRDSKVSVRDVADLIGGGAILGHRVVTLSREVHLCGIFYSYYFFDDRACTLPRALRFMCTHLADTLDPNL